MADARVVHVISGTRPPPSTDERARPTATRQLLPRHPAHPDVDIVVYHGRRAGFGTLWRRAGRALRVYRPETQAPPSSVDVMIAQRVDLVAAGDDDQAAAYRSRVPRPPASVVVIGQTGDDPWRPLIERFTSSDDARHGDDPGPLRPGRPLQIGVVAERSLGADLLVVAPGPSRPVERLTGSGPAIWHLLADGHTITEIVARLAPDHHAASPTISAEVEEFAAQLVRSGLAVPA